MSVRFALDFDTDAKGNLRAKFRERAIPMQGYKKRIFGGFSPICLKRVWVPALFRSVRPVSAVFKAKSV